jgi:hypothetical protein
MPTHVPANRAVALNARVFRRGRTFGAVAAPTKVLHDQIGFSELPHGLKTAPKKVAHFGSLSFQ